MHQVGLATGLGCEESKHRMFLRTTHIRVRRYVVLDATHIVRKKLYRYYCNKLPVYDCTVKGHILENVSTDPAFAAKHIEGTETEIHRNVPTIIQI